MLRVEVVCDACCMVGGEGDTAEKAQRVATVKGWQVAPGKTLCPDCVDLVLLNDEQMVKRREALRAKRDAIYQVLIKITRILEQRGVSCEESKDPEPRPKDGV